MISHSRSKDPSPAARFRFATASRPSSYHYRGAGANRSFLPYDTAHFTGRVNELRFLTTTPRSATENTLSIVAIDGMAGVGKTTLAVRLAHQLAHQYPEGHLFIDLHGYTHGQDPLEPDAALERLLLDFGLSPA